MTAPQTEVIEARERLADIEPHWWALWRRTPAALPFLAPAWLIPWWRSFAPGALFTLAAWSGGRLVGLAPGYIESGPLGRRILPLGISVSDHLDVLADPDCADIALSALAAAARSRAADWDVWEHEDLPPDAAALQLPAPEGWSDHVVERDACPLLQLPASARTLADALPKKKRRNLSLARNRCARRGAVRVARAAGDQAPGALDALVRLHRRRWETRGEAGVLASPEVLRFQREAVPLLEAAGLLRLHTLAIGEEIVAAHYALLAGGRAYVYLTGLDPDFEFESPGVVLMAEALGAAVDEGCREIDFLRGGEAYKYGWGATDRPNVKRSIRQARNG